MPNPAAPSPSTAQEPEVQVQPDESAAQNPPQSATAGDRPGWSWPRFTRNALIIAASIALAVWFWDKGIAPNIFPKNFGTVVEGQLYRSGELTPAATKKVVQEHNIRTIIDLGAHDEGSHEEIIAQRTADALGVTRHRFFLRGDATGDPNRYVQALRIMTDPEAQPVLVHCAAGAQRTGCAVALYRSIIEGVDAETALSEATQYRHDPRDNPRLPIMFRRHRDAIEQALKDGGTIPYVDGPFQDDN